MKRPNRVQRSCFLLEHLSWAGIWITVLTPAAAYGTSGSFLDLKQGLSRFSSPANDARFDFLATISGNSALRATWPQTSEWVRFPADPLKRLVIGRIEKSLAGRVS